ncbi:MAG: hypothetical protein BroJett003_20540 [Planctomycetota bacterium]|nr:MAG: hypothetical protein BroJett003_20540 [Planctomycetota bacterium]
MTFFDYLTRRKKSISEMSRSELRRQELLLEKDRKQMLDKVLKLAKDKQGLFERGAKEKTPEARQMLAQEFELRTTEQLMLQRQLNIRTKELLTVSRLRMLRENADRMKGGGKLGLISAKDMMRLGRLIEADSVKVEMYQERLDEVLALGREADEHAAANNEAGRAVMDIWEKLDRGEIADEAQGFDEADRRVRERQQAAE